MGAEFTFVSIALSIGIAQGFFLSLVLFFSGRRNHNANTYLAIFLTAFTLLTLSDFFNESKLIIPYPHCFLLFEPLVFFIGPLSYFYVRALTTGVTKFKAKSLNHFIIGAFFWLAIVPFYFIPLEEKRQLAIESYNKTTDSIDYLLLFAAVHLLIYFILSMVKIKKYQQQVRNNFSYLEKINLNWLRNYLIINSILVIFFMLRVLLRFDFLTFGNDILFTFTMYIIGYYGLSRPEIFFVPNYLSSVNTGTSEPIEQKKKYATSTLKSDDLSKIVELLKQKMADHKYFLKNDLKLPELAEYLSIQPHQLSQAINELLEKNFFDFINEYRVEEVKNRLLSKEYEHLTILAIGLDSGFNSKAAFNLAFKKFTGKTPTEYKKQVLLQNKAV